MRVIEATCSDCRQNISAAAAAAAVAVVNPSDGEPLVKGQGRSIKSIMQLCQLKFCGQQQCTGWLPEC